MPAYQLVSFGLLLNYSGVVWREKSPQESNCRARLT
jgi:hypothetical protein